MMGRVGALVWMWCLLGFATSAWAEAPSVAAFPIRAEYGVPAGMANVLGDNMVEQLRSSRAFSRVVSSREIEAVLGLEQQLLQQAALLPADAPTLEPAPVAPVATAPPPPPTTPAPAPVAEKEGGIPSGALLGAGVAGLAAGAVSWLLALPAVALSVGAITIPYYVFYIPTPGLTRPQRDALFPAVSTGAGALAAGALLVGVILMGLGAAAVAAGIIL
ncbi:MAG: hypothetical protein AB2A00_37780 [Myxococcota bacterium]